MKIPQRLTTLLVAGLLVVAAVPASAASRVPAVRIISCSTSATSVTVRWDAAKPGVGRRITGYSILTQSYQVPRRMYGAKARVGTVHGLTPRTAYRVQLYTFVKSGGQSIPACLVYTKLLSGKRTTPMRAPLITSLSATDTTISVAWLMNKSATSALPSSYEVWVAPEATVDSGTGGGMVSMSEPLSTTSATFTGLVPGTTYDVSVGTVNAWGQAGVADRIETSPPSATTTTTVPAPTTTL